MQTLSNPLPPSFKTFITDPQRLDCIGEVTVLNQKNKKRDIFKKGLYTGSGGDGMREYTSSLLHQKHNAEGFQ